MISRPPATPDGLFGSSLPALAPAAAAFAPPARAGFPVGGIILSAVSNLDNFEAGWWPCDGSQLLGTSYPALATRLGTGASSYWGAATTGFVKLPDLRDRFALVSGPTYSPRATGGAATHTLALTEIPAHDHPAPGGGVFVTSIDTPGANITTGGGGYKTSTATGSRGGGGAHNNMPPYVAIAAFIRALP